MNTILFQSAKLGDIPEIIDELVWAKQLLDKETPVERVYGVSGGALVALSFSLTLSARINPQTWSNAGSALEDFQKYLQRARSWQIRGLNLNPIYGPYNLIPFRRWVYARLRRYARTGMHSDIYKLNLSELAIPCYLCTIDRDGTFTSFGPQNESLQFQYQHAHIGPPRDAPIVDALMAALSTLLSTEPVLVNGEFYRDCRPAIVDAGAIIVNMQSSSPEQLLRKTPYAPIRRWKQNWITSSFIMHSQNERNQVLLASYYLDLLSRHQSLLTNFHVLSKQSGYIDLESNKTSEGAPQIGHIDLPYVGSTEAFTNMRQSVENKESLMKRFHDLLHGQLDNFPFNSPANVIYGAGGFSGILAGLVTTRAVDTGFERGGGEVRQIYGVSAGVLNGFFHAVKLASEQYPDLYTPAARNALSDLEEFIAHVEPKKVARINKNPFLFWQGWANLGPLEEFLIERLSAYTGSKYTHSITFDDIGLPMTIAAARLDGFTDWLGMSKPDRRMVFAGQQWQVKPAPIVRAMVAGWSMNTYIIPARYGDQSYTDGGGTFYDPALFVACMDVELTNLLNIHLDEPDGHSYNLPPRPNLMRILFDTHNYVFPEERRRMRFITDLLYQHFQLRMQYTMQLAHLPTQVSNPYPLPADFRREWDPII